MNNVLKQDSTQYTTYFGWYGNCDSNCENFDLTAHSDIIYAVYQFEQDGSGVKTFLSSAPPFLRPFSELKCGNGYWIVLTTGNGEIPLENFVCSTFESNAIGHVIHADDCQSISLTDETPVM